MQGKGTQKEKLEQSSCYDTGLYPCTTDSSAGQTVFYSCKRSRKKSAKLQGCSGCCSIIHQVEKCILIEAALNLGYHLSQLFFIFYFDSTVGDVPPNRASSQSPYPLVLTVNLFLFKFFIMQKPIHAKLRPHNVLIAASYILLPVSNFITSDMLSHSFCHLWHIMLWLLHTWVRFILVKSEINNSGLFVCFCLELSHFSLLGFGTVWDIYFQGFSDLQYTTILTCIFKCVSWTGYLRSFEVTFCRKVMNNIVGGSLNQFTLEKLSLIVTRLKSSRLV